MRSKAACGMINYLKTAAEAGVRIVEVFHGIDMTTVIELQKGYVYFYAGFFDSEFNFPCINSFVYEGYDEEHGHLFRDAASHVEIQEGIESTKGHYICFPEGEISGILDKRCLVDWLRREHSPKHVGQTYEYKVI